MREREIATRCYVSEKSRLRAGSKKLIPAPPERDYLARVLLSEGVI